MDLSKFKILSQDEYEALTAKDQAKYEIQLEEFKTQERAKESEKIKNDAIEAAKEAVKEDTKNQIDAAVKVVKDEYDAKIESAQAEMKRAKIAHNENRGANKLSDEIMEAFSSEKGEQMLKDFVSGQKSKLNMDFESKAVLKPTGALGSGVAPQFTSIVELPHDTYHARMAIPTFTTQSDLVKQLQYTVDPDADGWGMVAEGGQKPNLGYIPNLVDFPVRKIAGILDVSEESLEDIVGLREYWAYELPQAFYDFEDFQVFKGDGTGQNLEGLWYQADNQTFPQGIVTSASNTWDKIAAAITEVRKKPIKRNTTSVFVSPADYMNLLINKAEGSGEYDYPVIMGNDNILRIGGVPIMWSNVFDDGEGLVGDFARGSAIYQKKGLQIRYSDENKDNFEKNIVSIRLEAREALVIRYPESFKRLLLGDQTS